MEENKTTSYAERRNEAVIEETFQILMRTVDYILFKNQNPDLIKPFKAKPESGLDKITYTSDIVSSLLSRQLRQEFKL